MEDTKWKNKTLNPVLEDKLQNDSIIENLENMELSPKSLKQDEVTKMEKKIESVYDERKGFTKLPVLESIYNDKTQNEKQEYDMEEEDYVVVEGMSNLIKGDFADRELREELEDLGLMSSPKQNTVSGGKPKANRYCKAEYKVGDMVHLNDDENKETWKVEKVQGQKLKLKKGDTKKTVQASEVYKSIFSSKNFLQLLPSFIYVPFVLIEYIIKKIGIWYSTIASLGEANNKDKRLVISGINGLIKYFLTIFVTYNWFFIWCCLDDKEEPVKRTKLDAFWLNEKYGGLVEYLIGLAWFPFHILMETFSSRETPLTIPSVITSMLETPVLQFSFIFIVIYSLIDYFYTYIMLLAQGSDPSYLLLVVFIVGALAGTRDKTPEEQEEDAEKWTIYKILRWVFQVIFNYGLYSITCISSFAYLLLNSLFGISIYKKEDEGYFDAMKSLRKYMTTEEEKSPCEGDGEDDNECISFFDGIMRKIRKALTNTIDILLLVGLIFVLFYSQTNYNLNIKSQNLRIGLNVTIMMLISLFCLAFYFKDQIYDVIQKFIMTLSGFGYLANSGENEETKTVFADFDAYEDAYDVQEHQENIKDMIEIMEIQNKLNAERFQPESQQLDPSVTPE